MSDSTIVLDLPDGVYADPSSWSMIRHSDVFALTAGAYPVKPPSSWFENPALANLTPLTIEDSGRVYGHIAAWHTSHIGMAGGVKPPRSKSNYAYYRTGVVKCDDDKLVDVGQITLTGGHAPLNVGVAKAVAHYDDTKSAIMDVASGEDRHGIWVAGALRPDVSEEQLRAIRASSVSGDWRPINGKLELVAVCAVNAPGFPIPRARVASGAPIALVAAGVEPLIEIAMNDRIEADVEDGIRAGLELFHERILRLESVVMADASAPEVAPEVDVNQLRKRVRGGSALAASLRERVRGPLPTEVVEDVQSLAASLRERVRGADAGPKGRAPKALTAARTPWNPLLHPRGADGRFIEVGSWVRWLRQGFGSTRRGQVVDIIPDPNVKSRDGIPGRVVARVEFPDRDGKTVVHTVPFDELEKVAPPKGHIDEPGDTSKKNSDDKGGNLGRKIAAKAVGHLIHDDEHHIGEGGGGADGPSTEDGNDTANRPGDEDAEAIEDAVKEAVDDVLDEAVPDTPEERVNPDNDQLAAEELADLSDAEAPFDEGLIETPYVPPSDEWLKTSEWFEELQGEDSPVSDFLVDELDPKAYSETSDWADAVRLARSRYEGWRAAQLKENQDADVSLDAYLDWLEKHGLKASLVAGLRTESRVRGANGLLAHATSYWTKEKRDEAARNGVALEDGSYPIDDVEDLRKAIDAFGRAKHEIATKRHIIRRANLLDSLGLLPKGWVASGFDPARHLRGPDGKFISQGGGSRTAAAGSETPDTVDELRGRVHGTR